MNRQNQSQRRFRTPPRYRGRDRRGRKRSRSTSPRFEERRYRNQSSFRRQQQQQPQQQQQQKVVKKTRFASRGPSSGGGGSNEKKSGEFSSPGSFEDAWSSGFFDSGLKKAVTAFGFNINSIPDLLSLPLGGRLRHSALNFKELWPIKTL